MERKAGVFVNKLDDKIKKKALAGIAILGVAAVTVVGVMSIGKSGQEKQPDPLVDLNSPESPDFVNNGGDGNTTVNPPSVTIPPTGDGTGQTSEDNKKPEDDKKPEDKQPDGQDNPNSDKTQTADGSDNPAQNTDGSSIDVADGSTGDGTGEGQEDNKEVLSPQVIAESLNFQKEAGLLWPLHGDVIIPYSPEHGVFHYTLEQFRTSNSVVLSSEVGTPVFAAAKGVVVSISDNVRTGKTVKLALGNDTYLVYGQLALDGLKEGDVIEEGQCIGAVAEPTRYYVIEGPNLYFQVLEGEETINPMMLLREKENTANAADATDTAAE